MAGAVADDAHSGVRSPRIAGRTEEDVDPSVGVLAQGIARRPAAGNHEVRRRLDRLPAPARIARNEG